MYTDEAIAKLPFFVTPAKAGVSNQLNDRDSCFRRNDNQVEKVNFAITPDYINIIVALLIALSALNVPSNIYCIMKGSNKNQRFGWSNFSYALLIDVAIVLICSVFLLIFN